MCVNQLIEKCVSIIFESSMQDTSDYSKHSQKFSLYADVPLFQVSGCWNRGVPLYREVSSFQGVGIEEFHCIQRCPHFRVLE